MSDEGGGLGSHLRPVRSLGIVATVFAARHEGHLYIHHSFGRVIDALAARFEKVVLCVPVIDAPPKPSRDYRLQSDRVELIEQPFYSSSIRALPHAVAITRAYLETCRRSRSVLIRGMCPFVGAVYAAAWASRCKVAHWIVGNPVALLRSHRRTGRLFKYLSLAYALQDRVVTKIGARLTKAAYICNGGELGKLFESPRTRVVVSSTVTREDFFERMDTCTGPIIRIFFVGFLRPEKGVEFLIEAMSRLETTKPAELVIAGPSDGFEAYRVRLDAEVARLGLADKVSWMGYVRYGPPLRKLFRGADLFAFPSLSEGTPRVLVEARANSLPVVATNVGGIPSSVEDGVDGLLVPPRDPQALADAISKIVENGDLRRQLIRNGRERAYTLTLDHFVDVVDDSLKDDRGFSKS